MNLKMKLNLDAIARAMAGSTRVRTNSLLTLEAGLSLPTVTLALSSGEATPRVAGALADALGLSVDEITATQEAAK